MGQSDAAGALLSCGVRSVCGAELEMCLVPVKRGKSTHGGLSSRGSARPADALMHVTQELECLAQRDIPVGSPRVIFSRAIRFEACSSEMQSWLLSLSPRGVFFFACTLWYHFFGIITFALC